MKSGQVTVAPESSARCDTDEQSAFYRSLIESARLCQENYWSDPDANAVNLEAAMAALSHVPFDVIVGSVTPPHIFEENTRIPGKLRHALAASFLTAAAFGCSAADTFENAVRVVTG